MTNQEKNENVIEGIKKKLKTLDTDPRTIDGVAKIFWAAENEKDVEFMQKRLECYPGRYMGSGLVYSYFEKLMELKPEILEEAKQKLGKLGRRLSPTFFDEFFHSDEISCDMSCDLHPKYDAYSQEFRDFHKAACQFALNKMKEYLGVEINTPVKRSFLYEVMYHTVGKVIELPAKEGPFIGEIKTKTSAGPSFPMSLILDHIFHTDESNQNHPGWKIWVEDKKGEANSFSYAFKDDGLERMVALDNEFDIGDHVKIDRYSNGSYSYPVKHGGSQAINVVSSVITK